MSAKILGPIIAILLVVTIAVPIVSGFSEDIGKTYSNDDVSPYTATLEDSATLDITIAKNASNTWDIEGIDTTEGVNRTAIIMTENVSILLTENYAFNIVGVDENNNVVALGRSAWAGTAVNTNVATISVEPDKITVQSNAGSAADVVFPYSEYIAYSNNGGDHKIILSPGATAAVYVNSIEDIITQSTSTVGYFATSIGTNATTYYDGDNYDTTVNYTETETETAGVVSIGVNSTDFSLDSTLGGEEITEQHVNYVCVGKEYDNVTPTNQMIKTMFGIVPVVLIVSVILGIMATVYINRNN